MATAGRDKNTPLHLAAIKGFTNVGRKLIENGAYVAAENKNGLNPLALAIQYEHCEFALLMVTNMEAARSVKCCVACVEWHAINSIDGWV